MHDRAPDKANVIAVPPLIYATAFVLGFLIYLVLPIRMVPSALAPWLGGGLVLVSFPIALWALHTLTRANTTFDTMKPTTALVTAGPYRYSRNPIYLSLTLLYLGVALLINALWILLVVVPLLVVIQRGVIAREEAYLTRKFGDVYKRYKAQVRRWI